MPQGLRLGARRFGDLLPAFLDLVELPRGLFDVVGRRGAIGLEVVFRAQRLGPRDQLLLDRCVREALPLVHLAKVLQPRRDRAERGFQAFRQAVTLAVADAGWRGRINRRTQIARDPVGFAQRQVLGGRAALRALDQLLDALHLLADSAFFGGPALRGVLFELALRVHEALRNRGIEILGLVDERRPLGGDLFPRFFLDAGRSTRCAPLPATALRAALESASSPDDWHGVLWRAGTRPRTVRANPHR